MFGKFSTNKYGLGDLLCSLNLPYICEEETAAKEKSIPTSQQEIPSLEGYEFLPPLGFYNYHQNYVNWQEAVDVCAQEGGHLLIINSEQERVAITALVNRYSTMLDIWTGVHDHYQEGHYVTIFSKFFIYVG